MAEPILQAASNTIVPGTDGSAKLPTATTPQPATLGLSDPAFMEGLASAFEQSKAGATTYTPKPVEADDAEPEDVLTPPKPEEKPKVEPQKDAQQPKTEKAKTKAEQWKELHRLKDAAEQRAKELEEKFRQAEERAKSYDPEEYKRLKAERDDYESRLKAFAVEHDPAFEAQMTQRTNRIKTEAETALGDQSQRFLSLLNLPEGDFKRQQISAMAQDQDDFTKFSMMQIAAEHRKLSLEKQEYVRNARENYQKIIETQTRQAEAMRTKVMSDFDSTVRQWQDPKNGIAVLQLKDGDEAWNNEVRGTVDLARNILTGKLPPEDLIKASIWSATAPRILKSMHALQSENATLRKELESLKAAAPDATRAGGGSEQATENEDEYKGMSYADIIARKASLAGGFANR